MSSQRPSNAVAFGPVEHNGIGSEAKGSKALARTLLVAFAVAAHAISFSAMGQGGGSAPKVCNFKVTYDGTTQTLDADSDPLNGTSLSIGDRFLLDIRAAGGGLFESKTARRDDGSGIFASLFIQDCATRTGTVTTTLLLDGRVVSQDTESEIQQSCVHVGAQLAPTLTVGLRFDQILVDYRFLASTTATNVLQGPPVTKPVTFEWFSDPNFFTFHPGSDAAATQASAGSSNCTPLQQVLARALNFPQGIGVWRPAGANKPILYIADRNNHRVWKLDLNAAEPMLQSVVGTGVKGYNGDPVTGDNANAATAQLNGPEGVAVDANGNVYIADTGNRMVRKLEAGKLLRVAGTGARPGIVNRQLALGIGGAARQASFVAPSGLAVGGNNLYITDRIAQVAVKVPIAGCTLDQCVLSHVAGVAGTTGNLNGAAFCPAGAIECSQARLNDPRGVAVDGAENVYIADAGNNKIRKVAGGNVSDALANRFNSPAGVAVAADGSLYVTDTSKHQVLQVSDQFLRIVAGTGKGSASELDTPMAVALDPSGDVYIADKTRVLSAPAR